MVQWLDEHWHQIVQAYLIAGIVVPIITLIAALVVRTKRAVIYIVILGGLVGGLFALGGTDALKIAGLIVGVAWLPLWFFFMYLPLGGIKGVKEKEAEPENRYADCNHGCTVDAYGSLIFVAPRCREHNI